jgi:hypothetical protein
MTLLLETRKMYLRIDPRQIHFLKFVLEGYDGLAVLSTVDARSGIVLLRFPDDSATDLMNLLADLAPEIGPKKISREFLI